MNEKDKELEALAKPLIDFLRDNYHPHTAILITDDRVAVVETVLSIPQPIDD